MLKKLIKLVFIFGLLYQTPIYSKSTSFNDFNSRDLSNYFSGIIAYENQNNSKALKFFNLSKVLLNKHDSYLKRYVNSLVLDNKIPQAINVIKNNGNKDNADFYDAYLILIIDSLKKNNFDEADEYLTQSLKFQDQNRINLVIFEALKQYIYTFKNKKILNNKKNFGNLSLIAETFQRCYLNDEKTGAYFLNLINSQQGDYSRYIFFYLNYLIDKNKINAAENVVSQFDYMNSTILLSQSKSWVENKKFKEFNKIFSCQNHKDVVSEFLFLVSNLYSSQDNFEKSNFYLNLSNYLSGPVAYDNQNTSKPLTFFNISKVLLTKHDSSLDDFEQSNFYLNLSNYLNPKFEFNLSLVIENYYLNEEFNKVKKILTKFNKKDEFYYWYRIKKEAQIIVEEQNYENAIKFIHVKFNQIDNPNLKMIFDVANFHKKSKKHEKAMQ